VEVEGELKVGTLACCVVSTASDVPLVDDALVLREGDPASDVVMRTGAGRGW